MTEQSDFYDRKDEMKSFEDKYSLLESSGKGMMIAVYGRRRVGKTELVRRFISKRNSLYLYVDLAERKVILHAMTEAIKEQLGETVLFNEFSDFFKYLSEKPKDKRFILVIDEFQRFVDIAPEFITSLQKNWDNGLKNGKMMIILVGSSIGMMQKITCNKAGALYGRATRMKMSPFKYKDMREMFSELSEEEKIKRYAVFGGTPYYLEKTKRFSDTLSAVNELVLEKNGELSEEPKNLMEYENVRIHAKYNSILQSISEGKEVLKEIQDYTKIRSSTLPPYLERLDTLLDLIERNDPVLGKERLRRYKIRDNYFKFWYRFISRNQTPLNIGNKKYVSEIINDEINAYTGKIFEEVIKELLVSCQGKTIQGHEINYEEIGGWWDRNGNEIDVIARNHKNRTILLGEVKWTNKPVDFDVVDDLVRKTSLIGVAGKYTYLLASKSGFTEKAMKKIKDQNIIHLDLKDITETYEGLSKKR